jgi:hypothetical protein
LFLARFDIGLANGIFTGQTLGQILGELGGEICFRVGRWCKGIQTARISSESDRIRRLGSTLIPLIGLWCPWRRH